MPFFSKSVKVTPGSASSSSSSKRFDKSAISSPSDTTPSIDDFENLAIPSGRFSTMSIGLNSAMSKAAASPKLESDGSPQPATPPTASFTAPAHSANLPSTPTSTKLVTTPPPNVALKDSPLTSPLSTQAFDRFLPRSQSTNTDARPSSGRESQDSPRELTVDDRMISHFSWSTSDSSSAAVYEILDTYADPPSSPSADSADHQENNFSCMPGLGNFFRRSRHSTAAASTSAATANTPGDGGDDAATGEGCAREPLQVAHRGVDGFWYTEGEGGGAGGAEVMRRGEQQL